MGSSWSSSLRLHTPLCDLLDIRYPLVQAPMAGGWTTPELVSAVCEAGGGGVLAGARISPQRLQEDIRAVKARTNRPFGVNFLLAPPEQGGGDVATVQRFLDGFREELGLAPGETALSLPSSPLQEQLEVVFEEGVPLLSLAMGDPGELFERAHEEGVRTIAMVTSVKEAVLVAERGTNMVYPPNYQ